METDRLTREELIEREKAVIDKICSNDDYAYNFFHEQCRPLISKILWTIYGNNGDYDELVNELYLYLKKPNKEGEYWHNLKTFDCRTSLFDWIKTVAVRHFYTPVEETFVLPESFLDSGLAEKIFAELDRSESRKYMYFKYITKLNDNELADKLHIEVSQLSALHRRSVRLLKKTVRQKYPEHLDYMFVKEDVVELNIEEAGSAIKGEEMSSAGIDALNYLAAMPDNLYRYVLYALFIENTEPEELAVEMNRKVSNIYNLKSRGLDQLRDVVLFSNEIQNLESFINLIDDDRKKLLLHSIFIDKRGYEEVCSMLNINESKFKKLKKDALKELKNKIFKAKP